MHACTCSVVELLVQTNAKCVDWEGSDKETPLLKVCRYSYDIKTAKLLVDKGANVNAQ